MITTQHLTAGALAVGGIAVVGAIVAGIVAATPDDDGPPERWAWVPVAATPDDVSDGDTPVVFRDTYENLVADVRQVDPNAVVVVSASVATDDGLARIDGVDSIPPAVLLEGTSPRAGEVVISTGLQEATGLGVGDALPLPAESPWSEEPITAPYDALQIVGISTEEWGDFLPGDGWVSTEDAWTLSQTYGVVIDSEMPITDTYIAWDGDVPALNPWRFDDD
ncbi:hypothetical protein [Demequina sp. NBRC 110051]|uniref:hypothetical protein n=1 Tax=Demequina sp. NBRC 110051 TaxID=1570340 RepID=UPI0009FDDB29|nr:hypothetical protein [Demequina sp. NBRC 110051]